MRALALLLSEAPATARSADPARPCPTQTVASPSTTRLAGHETAPMLSHAGVRTRIVPVHDDCNPRVTPIEFP